MTTQNGGCWIGVGVEMVDQGTNNAYVSNTTKYWFVKGNHNL